MQRHLNAQHWRQQLALRLAELFDRPHQFIGVAISSLLPFGEFAYCLRCQLHGCLDEFYRANRRHQAEDHAG
ncbi:hypothetical protein D9M69_715550 [compost metagenome]